MAQTCNCMVAHKITQERARDISKVSGQPNLLSGARTLTRSQWKKGVLTTCVITFYAGFPVSGEDQNAGRPYSEGQNISSSNLQILLCGWVILQLASLGWIVVGYMRIFECTMGINPDEFYKLMCSIDTFLSLAANQKLSWKTHILVVTCTTSLHV